MTSDSTDPRAFTGDRLRQESERLRRLARAVAGADGDDVAQDAWVRALERPPAAGTSLGRWLAGVVRMRASETRRADVRRRRRETVVARPEAAGEAAGATVAHLDLLRHLLDRLRELDEPFRTTLWLHYVEGKPTADVAQRLGIAEATVRTRLFRGIATLRARLDRTTSGGRAEWLASLGAVGFSGGATRSVATAGSKIATTAPATATVAKKIITAIVMKKTIAFAAVLALTAAIVAYTSTQRRDARPTDIAAAIVESDSDRATGSLPVPGSAAIEPLGSAPDAVSARRAVAVNDAGTPPILVTGIVRDADGSRPIAGAVVRLASAPPAGRVTSEQAEAAAKAWSAEADPDALASSGTTETRLRRVETGADGRFRIQVPRSLAKPWIVGTKAGFVGAAAAVPGAPESDDSEVRVDLELRPAVRLAGRVESVEGTPIPDAAVWSWFDAGARATTDADGHFVLDGIDPDRPVVYVHANANGYLDDGATVDFPRDDARDELVIRLLTGARVSGVVVANGAPLASARLEIDGSKVSPKTRSDDSGRFVFDAVRPGARTIVVRHPEHPVTATAVSVAASGRDDVVLAMEPGRDLVGTVRGPRGEPVVGAKVLVRPGSETSSAKDAAPRGRTAITDDDGRFAFHGLPTGPLQVTCAAAGHETIEQPVAAGVTRVELRLLAGAWVAGTVTDATSGAPITAYSIRFAASGADRADKSGAYGGWTEVRDPAGCFEIGDRGFAIGTAVDALVRAPGYPETRSAGMVATATPRPGAFTIRLVSGATLSGLVLTPDRRPVEGARVRWATTERPARLGIGKDGAETATDGRFELAGVAAAAGFLVVEHPAHGVSIREVTIPPAAPTHEVTIVLEPRARLNGVVRDARGAPLANAAIALSIVAAPGLAGRANAPDWRTRTDAEGRYAFQDLPPGRFRIARFAAEPKPHEVFAEIVDVVGNGTTVHDLTARGTASIELTLTAPDVTPDEVYVWLEPIADPDVPAVADTRSTSRWAVARTGRVRLEELEPGRYQLRAWGGGNTANHTAIADLVLEDAVTAERTLRLAPETAGR